MKRWRRLKLEGRVRGDKAWFWVLGTILNFGFFVIHIHFVHSTFSQIGMYSSSYLSHRLSGRNLSEASETQVLHVRICLPGRCSITLCTLILGADTVGWQQAGKTMSS